MTCQINRHSVVRVYRGKTKFWPGRTYAGMKKQDSSNLSESRQTEAVTAITAEGTAMMQPIRALRLKP